METRRRSARFQAKNAIQPETDEVKVSISTRKRNSDEHVDAPPKTRSRKSSISITTKNDKKVPPISKKPTRERIKGCYKSAQVGNPFEQSLEEEKSEKQVLTVPSRSPTSEEHENDKEGTTSSMESFAKSSDEEEAQQIVSRSNSRNNPRRSCLVSSYKPEENVISDSSDLETLESDKSSVDSGDNTLTKKGKKKMKNTSRKKDRAMIETSADERDSDEDQPKKKSIRTRTTSSQKKRSNGKVGNGSRQSGGTVKTLADLPTSVWNKQRAKLVGTDIVIPPRKLARGEQKMLVFRIIASQLAAERTREIDLEEGYRILDQIKADFAADREGFMRRVLLTGGRNIEDDVEKKKQEDITTIENDNSSSSEDEWLEMEPVDISDDKKLEVTVENKNATGYDWWAIYLRLEVNKAIREKWDNTYKAHIICYLAHLLYVVKVALHERTVPYLLITQLPTSFLEQQGNDISLSQAKQLAIWFISTFKVAASSIEITSNDKKDFAYEETARYAVLASKKCYETDLERSVLLFNLFVGLEVSARICVNCKLIPRRWDEEDQTQSLKEGSNVSKKKTKEVKKLEKMDYWVEYWNTKEKRWICIDPISGDIDKPEEIERRLNMPITFIFAIDEKKGIRDVTARYASDFLTPLFRRRRTNLDNWIIKTLKTSVIMADAKRAELEDLHFHTEMVKRPLPTTFKDLKNHPLYVLEKDLLKYQAIYPPVEEQTPVGEVRGHKIYPRSTVHTLLGIKKWEKLARSIKEGEKPYKVVKAIQNPMIPKEERVEKWLDVYGFWQTEPYKRPIVENGIIPRNEHGNVYMYQSSMCPIGAVHLPLPNLPQIARRLDKECVPAVVGWDFNHCGNWPMIEGACVLEEDRDLFIDEWKKDEDERIAREKKKRTDRANKNWKKFIQGMLRIHRIKAKFGNAVEEEKKQATKKKKEDKGTNSKPEPSIIDNTKMPTMNEFTLQDVMKFRN